MWYDLQAADHLSADTPLFHSDMLRPLVVECMRVAVQELSQRVQQQCGQPGEVGPGVPCGAVQTSDMLATMWQLDGAVGKLRLCRCAT
jgi:hypothetical protein